MFITFNCAQAYIGLAKIFNFRINLFITTTATTTTTTVAFFAASFVRSYPGDWPAFSRAGNFGFSARFYRRPGPVFLV
jgi:hypothetical protein